ncbi:MAG: glycogen synthase GlgA [bacterium]|nr:glycogen synthase GlgA [bacterium]
MTALRILLVASEVAPFAKTGGLADVSAALATKLGQMGHDVRVLLPRYSHLRGPAAPAPATELGSLELEFGGRSYAYGFSRALLPDTDQEVLFVDCPELYGRQEYYTSDADEPVRFGLLCRAALELCQRTQWAPDVVHANDWHTGLLPLYLQTIYAWDELFANTRTVLTIHNIGYQGVFEADCLETVGLGESRSLVWQEDLAAGHVNWLKTGLLYADVLTTVSPTYAREIQTPEYGSGLDELLRDRSGDLVGILNGVDYDVWSPETDRTLPSRYDAEDLAGKARCRTALLERMEVQDRADLPVIGVISRLTGQKGFEILPDVLPVLLQRDAVHLCVLGSGEEKYERYFQWLRDAFPHRVGFFRGYDEALSHLVEAGSDLFLMPSRYEPCGLNQMYSLRYGTIPIVRRTGGLADTVESFDRRTGTGTGFVFEAFESRAVHAALEEALEVYADRAAWRALMRNAMQRDFSWERQAQHYVELYQRILSP